MFTQSRLGLFILLFYTQKHYFHNVKKSLGELFVSSPLENIHQFLKSVS